ncbi:hypothetical protein F5B21DRAFT_474239 [Xylaria acuta]|nr:hypothetical protein F5B21DRAFT_474239 [Xylaria acuta]
MSSRTSPILRRPGTGCSVTLSATLVPSQITHTPRCKCILASTKHTHDSSGQDEEEREQMERMAASVRCALAEGILESEKPALAFAMLLLGGEVVYSDSS